jgi:hypothetical protein
MLQALFWLLFSLLLQYKKDEVPLEGEKVTKKPKIQKKLNLQKENL